MKKSIIVLSLMISAFAATAQETEKHELRAGISDATGVALATSLVDEIPNAIIDAIFGTKVKYDKNNTLGMFELGYRYRLSDRIKIGADVSYIQMDRSYNRTFDEVATRYKGRDQYLMILPTAEFAYIKTPLLTFYGTAAAGILLGRATDRSSDKPVIYHSTFFAYQVNPVGLRVGKKIGAFAEFGYGYKGIATAGVSLRF